MDNVMDLIRKHGVAAGDLACELGWSATTASRKLNNHRSWTYDEMDKAARFLRLHGVPVGPADLRYLIRIGEEETDG
jgi:hypothetical protein